MKYGIDPNGGFYGAVDLKGNPIPEVPKSCVLNARILWTFAEAAIKFKQNTYTEVVDRAFSVLQKSFADQNNSGYFMSIDQNYQPLNTFKHTYAQAFVLYSLSKYYELKWRNHKIKWKSQNIFYC